MISPEDTVVIPGDISWALTCSEALADLKFLDSLSGKKILMKGNHDFWWTSVTKMKKTFEENECISRELLLVKVKYNRSNRKDIMEICNIMKAEIVDMSKYHMLIQLCDTSERVQQFLSLMQGISITEVARTGTVALQKCKENDS